MVGVDFRNIYTYIYMCVVYIQACFTKVLGKGYEARLPFLLCSSFMLTWDCFEVAP